MQQGTNPSFFQQLVQKFLAQLWLLLFPFLSEAILPGLPFKSLLLLHVPGGLALVPVHELAQLSRLVPSLISRFVLLQALLSHVPILVGYSEMTAVN